MIHFDKKTLEAWKNENIDTISLYFYESGCAGTKIGVETKKLPDCEIQVIQDAFHIYMRKSEVSLIENGHITQVGKKWIFTSPNINTRCGCGSSFSLKTNSAIQDKVARMKLAIQQKRDGVHK